MARQQFAGAAPLVHLSAGISDSDTTFAVSETASAYPDGSVGKFVVCLDRGTSSEEKILCSVRSSTSFTVDTRGYDGTTRSAHNLGATVEHVLDSLVVNEANAHVNDTTRDDHTQYQLKSLIGRVWGKDHGTVGDGTTDDRTAITNTDTAATSGKAVALSPGSYKVGSNLTIANPVVMEPGAKFVIPTGVTLTINGSFYAPVAQVFSCSGTGKVVFGTATNVVYGEWFGAVGDGSTDDVTALRLAVGSLAAGFLQLLGKTYAISDYIEITHDNVGIRGVGQTASILMSSGAGNDCVRVTGPGSGTYLNYNELAEFEVAHSVTPTTGNGVVFNWTAHSHVTNVTATDHQYGLSAKNTANLLVEHVNAVRARGTSGTAYGFFLDGTGANLSPRLSHCFAYGKTFRDAGGTFHGLVAENPSTQDTFVEHFEASEVTRGIFIDAAGTENFDIHLVKPIIDQFHGDAGIYITGALDSAAITILGGWTNPATIGSSSDNILVNGSRGVTVSGHQFFAGANYANQTGLAVTSSQQITASACIFKNFVSPVVLTSSSLCTVTGNSLFNLLAEPATIGISLVGSSRNNITSNSIDGSAAASVGTGVKLDNSSDYNNVGPNSINPGSVTTVYSLGTGTHNVQTGVST